MAKRKSTASSSGGYPVPTMVDRKREEDYRRESDFDTLQRAEEVRGDPARHKGAIDHGRKKIDAIGRVMRRARITGLRGKSGVRARSGR